MGVSEERAASICKAEETGSKPMLKWRMQERGLITHAHFKVHDH
jgi:hypothetical protein